jgi:hypothetical protein
MTGPLCSGVGALDCAATVPNANATGDDFRKSQDSPKDAFSLNLRCIRVTPAYFHREALGTRKRATQGAYAAQPDNVMALSARERRSKSVDMSRYNSSAIRSSSRGR